MLDAHEGTVTAVLGPTNTGKTHYAIERMLARESGIIGLPLRLLAREIYDRIVEIRGPNAVSLVTGEEKIAPARARYHVCTVEAMPLGVPTDFVAVDEIQLCADPDRGHVFTERLLHARGRYETLFLGSDTMRHRIRSLVPEARFQGRTRFSTLSWTGTRKLSRLRPRTAVVAFSVDQVYAIAELIRRQRGGAAVVMGALSPRTRNAQVALYQEGDVDYMVATDAIGMGLNMDVDHVAFAATAKFDGWRHRALEPNELAQIAGRAGRFTRDGTFGVTGEAPALAPETALAIEEHRFRPISKLMWRNTDLRFHSLAALVASLETSPVHPDLVRAPEAEDQQVLRSLAEDPSIVAAANRGDRIRLLWEVCQIPDFRKVSPAEHAQLVGRIYRFLLTDAHCIPSHWLGGQIGRLDRVHGDIDALSKRLAFIRTWTYVANRPGWVEDAEHWRGETRAVEDRLSDALHERLTQRFVDRRTSVLMRRLKQKERLLAEVNDKGDVSAEGHYLGRLDGFRFTIDESASGDELKTLRSASLSALGAELARRADRMYLSPDSEIDITDQGGLMWGGDAVGRVSRGDDPLMPKISVFVDDMADPGTAEKVERRLRHWLARRINALFEPMLAMRDDEAISGLARGVAFRLAETFGIIPRRDIADDIKALAQEDRALLRKHGVRFGQHFIFMPALLKPAPTRMRLLLWSLAQGLDDFPQAPPPGSVTLPVDPEAPEGYYAMAGYRPCGQRALRIDMLERLADLIRPFDARKGFEATQDMLSITGTTLDQFAELMQGLGFDAEKLERPRQAKQAPEAQVSATADADETGGTATTPEASAEMAAAAGMAEGATENAGTVAGQGEGTLADASAPSLPEAASNDVAPRDPAAPDAAEPAGDVGPGGDSGAEPTAAPEASAAPPSTAQAPEEAVDPRTAEPTEQDGPATDDQAAPAAGDGRDKTAPAGDAEDETAPAGGNGEAGHASTPDAAGTAVEPEVETYYMFRLRPRGRPRRDAGRKPQGAAGKPGGQPQRKGRGGKAKDAAAEAKGPRRGDAERKGREKDGDRPRRVQSKPPREEKPVDPDNPFAILQQLKNR